MNDFASPLWDAIKEEYDLVEDANALSPSFFCRAGSPIVDRKMVDALKGFSALENSDVRICLHSSPEASFQNMIIVHRNSNYYRPHEHLKNGESYHLLEGELGIPFFDDVGQVIDKRRMTLHDNVIARIPVGIAHAMFPLSDLVIFHESKSGPFIPGEDTVHPNWSPQAGDEEAIRQYKDTVLKSFD